MNFRETTHEPVIIAGAGPIGLACAVSARRRGIDPLVIDAGALVNSIVHYPTGMTFFTSPERLEIGRHPITCAGAKPTREEAMMYYRGVARTEELRVRTFTRLCSAERADSRIRCELETGTGREDLTCDRLVLATGYFDRPNLLGAPGEDLPHVRHYFDEAHLSWGLDVVVVGGKNSAVEAALQLFRAGARVTLVVSRHGAPSRRQVLAPAGPREPDQGRGDQGEARRHGALDRTRRDDDPHRRRRDGTPRADRVYALIGFTPDFELFRSMGIELDRVTERPVLDPETLETNVPGIYMAGSIVSGRAISEVFIENGRYDGEKIFGDTAARRHAAKLYGEKPRPVGE